MSITGFFTKYLFYLVQQINELLRAGSPLSDELYIRSLKHVLSSFVCQTRGYVDIDIYDCNIYYYCPFCYFFFLLDTDLLFR